MTAVIILLMIVLILIGISALLFMGALRELGRRIARANMACDLCLMVLMNGNKEAEEQDGTQEDNKA